MRCWGLTDPGCVRAQNQDSFRINQLDRRTVLAAVCDGMGGARSGNVASSLAVDVFMQEIKQSRRSGMNRSDVEELLRRAVALANDTVYEQAQQFEDFGGMGTTLVAAYVTPGCACVVNVGDSRAYHMGGGGIRRITTDHSVVQMMLQRGELTVDQARTYPGKNLITRAIGTEPTVEADLFWVELEPDDSLLLCTDGLSNLVDEQEILFEVVHGVHKEGCCQRLLDIAKNRGAPDNVTSLLILI